jgi:transcription-repair coupling factor (superfamily II helicase)
VIPAARRLAVVGNLVANDPTVAGVLSGLDGTLACPDAARPAVLAALTALHPEATFIVATATGSAAGQIADDLQALIGTENVALFPAWETLPFERISPNVETMGRRLEVLWRLRTPGKRPRIIVAGARALLQKTAPFADVATTSPWPIHLKVGMQIDPAGLVRDLVTLGYRREDLVELRGHVAQRGSIVDVFASTHDEPVRVEFWGDEIERLQTFNVNDQRSSGTIEEAWVQPAREFLVDEAMRERAARLVGEEPWGREHWERIAEGLVFDGMESWLPWFSDGSTLASAAKDISRTTDVRFVVVEPRRINDRGLDILAEEADLARALANTWGRNADATGDFPRLHAEPDSVLSGTGDMPVYHLLAAADNAGSRSVNASSWGPITNDPTAIVRRFAELVGEHDRVIVAADTQGSAQRISESLHQAGADVIDLDSLPDKRRDDIGPGIFVTVCRLHHGAYIPGANLALIAESDLTGRRPTPRRQKPRSAGTSFQDLKPGDYVVHYHHGVGKFEGLVSRAIGGAQRDYLLLAYKGGDKLYVPTDQIDTIRQYVGGETPTMHRLGGSDFQRAKSKVRSAVQEIAQELVVLYQRRVTAEGHSFAQDTPWQHEMEAAFPYVETVDQRKAIGEVKGDMERSVPMDRLICGDVGFGKTEVAVRAAFKAVQDGKQVAVLCPTTLLASQHGVTFRDRFAGFPVRVEVLSRFQTAAEAKKILAGLGTGEIDCVIGTHRLLQEGVKFKDLGLLVVDEEQRFGVQHKEAMKKMRTNVDVLTLSATPIPRTLEMSLVGIRDLSLLQTPPADRQPILTYVGELDKRLAVEAIRRELLREGQVFWVHNRVQSIEERAAELRELVPEARVAVAHGQMDEAGLERIVQDFWEGNFDVLVCTTIIESGIDMPTVNTLVVERADLLGLGQLHQLRGRVGRSGQRAYAYLFHPRDRVLSEDAYERLRAIGEATELGSGFKIAMRDLEIRGAGNILGEAQSGHIAAVGYDLYCQMVTEVVAEMKGEPIEEPSDLKLDISVSAFLPDTYVPTEDLRLEAYRRLAEVKTQAEVDDVRAEWLDRYGPMPKEAETLLAVGALRASCHHYGIKELTVIMNTARVSPVNLLTSQQLRLTRLSRGTFTGLTWRENEKQLVLPLPAPQRGKALDGDQLVAKLRELLDEMLGD